MNSRVLETQVPCGIMRALNGEVAEWSKAHAWKVCIRQRIEGSNPSLTAIQSAAKEHLGQETPESPQFAGFFVDRSVS